MPKIDSSILEMALVGLQAEVEKIEAAMAAIRKQLGVRGKSAVGLVIGDGSKRKRNLSAAALRRISLAQKKRWATYRAKQGATAKPAPKKTTAKRKMSPERKAALVANLAKARAARAAKRGAA